MSLGGHKLNGDSNAVENRKMEVGREEGQKKEREESEKRVGEEVGE